MTTLKPTLIKGEAAKKREAKEKKEMAIYIETRAARQGGSLMADICDALTKKYNVSKTTFYAILKRVERRINDKQQEAI